MLRDVFPIGRISDLEAAKVTEVFAKRQLALDVNARDRLVAIVLGHEAVSMRRVKLGSPRRPPIGEPAMRIELPPLVVEAVLNLVPDSRADASVIRSRIGLGIEIGRLQDRGGEGDLVLRRIVISVVGLWEHVPKGP